MALENFPRIDDYGDAAAEAKACRTDCALFDFSFLECARIDGDRAAAAVENFTGRSLQPLSAGQIFYAVRVDANGWVRSDLTVWRRGLRSFEVMSGRREDIADLSRYVGPGLDFRDMAGERAVFALQGPGSLEALRRLGDVEPIEQLGYFRFCRCNIAEIPCEVGRLGYTGEAGFEIIVSFREAGALWQRLSRWARPAGFRAADILRIEAGFVLFTNEFLLPVRPREAGLGRFHQSVDVTSPTLTLISFRADADLPCASWIPPLELKRPVAPGEIAVTSACQSIVAGGILGLGYMLAKTPAGTGLYDPTGTFRNIRRTARPFYDTDKRRPRAPWR